MTPQANVPFVCVTLCPWNSCTLTCLLPVGSAVTVQLHFQLGCMSHLSLLLEEICVKLAECACENPSYSTGDDFSISPPPPIAFLGMKSESKHSNLAIVLMKSLLFLTLKLFPLPKLALLISIIIITLIFLHQNLYIPWPLEKISFKI